MTEQPLRTSTHRPTKGRSPSYPAVSLDVAIARARAVYEKEGRHPAPIGAIVGHWGYKAATTGQASATYAALLKFGLLSDEGTGADRLGRLTQLALDILMKPNPAADIQTAALLPPIHAEMWTAYGLELPSDENLRYRLVVQGGFTETGCQDFIRQYRATLTFAKFVPPAAVPESPSPSSEPEGWAVVESVAGQPHPGQRSGGLGRVDSSGLNLTTIPVLLVGGQSIVIEGTFPVSDGAWSQFMAVLNAMKPGLVAGIPTDGVDRLTGILDSDP